DSDEVQSGRQPPHERRGVSGHGGGDRLEPLQKVMSPDETARLLLDVVMLVMRTVAADMRRSPRPLAPAQMGILMRIAAGPCTLAPLTPPEREELVSTLNILRRVLVASGDEACALIAKQAS